MRLSRLLIILVCVAVSGTVPNEANAQETSLFAAAEAAVEADPTWSASNASFEGIAIAERVGDDHWVVEAIVRFDERHARWPLRLSGSEGTWNVAWKPEPAYTAGLRNMLISGTLPTTENAPLWSSQRRLPTLPVIVTRARQITPFGEVADEAEDDTVQPIAGLVRQANRWVKEVLSGHPGPASVDFIVAGDVSWASFTRALYSISMAGLYAVYVVGIDEATGDTSALQALSPVALSDKEPGLVVAMYALESGHGFRLAMKGEVVAPSGCHEDMTFCSSATEHFEQALGEALNKDAPGFPMFAAERAVTTQDAIRYLDSATFAVFNRMLLMGYIQR